MVMEGYVFAQNFGENFADVIIFADDVIKNPSKTIIPKNPTTIEPLIINH